MDSIRADGLEEWEGMSASQALIGASDGSLPEPLSVLSKIYHSTSFNKNAISKFKSGECNYKKHEFLLN